MKHRKEAGFERHMFAGELASFLGVTPRSVRRWMHDPTFPQHTDRDSRGYKLWSPEQARRCLEWRKLRVPEQP